MKDLKTIGIAVLVIGVLVAIIALEHNVWTKCRATNSWFYCMRVLGK
jgi:hypothetical protein